MSNLAKKDLLDQMCDRNHLGDKSVCIGQFTIDYLKDRDKFYLTYPSGASREIDADTAARYMGLSK